jgi:hypothetical protein
MPKEHMNSEAMSPNIHKLSGFYNLPEQKDLPYLMEAIINDKGIVATLLDGAIAIRDVCGPGRPRLEARSEYRCSKCAHSDITIFVKIPSILSVEDTTAIMELLDKRMHDTGVHHDWVRFVQEHV